MVLFLKEKFFLKGMKAINSLLPKLVTLPDVPTTKRIMDEIELNSGFPYCIGFIDGSLTRITPPPKCGSDFYTRKSWNGFNNMVI